MPRAAIRLRCPGKQRCSESLQVGTTGRMEDGLLSHIPSRPAGISRKKRCYISWNSRNKLSVNTWLTVWVPCTLLPGDQGGFGSTGFERRCAILTCSAVSWRPTPYPLKKILLFPIYCIDRAVGNNYVVTLIDEYYCRHFADNAMLSVRVPASLSMSW
jgi:hypothetical protein